MTTLRDYLAVVRQRWLIVLVTIVVATGGAVAFSVRQLPVYEAGARVLIETLTGADSADLPLAGNTVLTEAEVMRSEVVAVQVAQSLRLTEPTDEILDKISVSAVPNTDVLIVRARAESAVDAANLANSFATIYIDHRSEQISDRLEELAEETAASLSAARERMLALDRELDRTPRSDPEREVLRIERNQALRRVAALQEQHDALIDRSLVVGSGSEVIQFAAVPSEPANPGHLQAGILGFLLAIPLAVGLALLRDSLSDRIKTKEEAEDLTGAPTLALVPLDPAWTSARTERVAVRLDPGSVVAEAYRTLRVNVEFAGGRDRTGAILVTSAGPGEGKTATSVNLALAFAEAGRTTLLIDADLRRPRAHRFMDTTPSPGLAEVAGDPGEAARAIRRVAPNLRFLPSGLTEAPDRVLGGRDAGGLLASLGEDADVTIVDAPTVLGAAETSVLAAGVDGVVLVLFVGTTRRAAAVRAAEQVRRVGGRVLGLVLIGAPADHYAADYSARQVTS